MSKDPIRESLFEMRLEEIYNNNDWLQYEITLPDFIGMFPVHYKDEVAQKPEKPEEYEFGRDVFLQVLVAFKQSFN